MTEVDAMITERVARATDVISFGPFTLVASERLLMKEGAPVELGSRTLDILIALVSRPNEVVGKRGTTWLKSGPTSPWKKGVYGFISRGCARRSATGRTAHDTSPLMPGGVTASSLRSRCRQAEPTRTRRTPRLSRTQACQPVRREWSGGQTAFSRFQFSSPLRASSPSWAPAGSARPRSPWRLRMICWRRSPGRCCSSILERCWMPTWRPFRWPRCWGCRFNPKTRYPA